MSVKLIYTDPPPSLGCENLRALLLSGSKVANIIGVTNVTGIAWLRGTFTPQGESRERLFTAFQIPPEHWGMRATPGASFGVYTRAPGKQRPEIAEISTTRKNTEHITVIDAPRMDAGTTFRANSIEPRALEVEEITTVEATMSTLEATKRIMREIRQTAQREAPIDERNKLMQMEINALALLSKVEESTMRMTDRILREHPEWQEIKRGLVSCVIDCESCSNRMQAFLARKGHDGE